MTVWCQRTPYRAYRRRAAFPAGVCFAVAARRPDEAFAGVDLPPAPAAFFAGAEAFVAALPFRAPATFFVATAGLAGAVTFLPPAVGLAAGALVAAFEVEALPLPDAVVAGFAGAFGGTFGAGLPTDLAEVILPAGAADVPAPFAAAGLPDTAAVVRDVASPDALAAAGALEAGAGVDVAAGFALGRPDTFGGTTTGGFGCLKTWTNRNWSMPGR